MKINHTQRWGFLFLAIASLVVLPKESSAKFRISDSISDLPASEARAEVSRFRLLSSKIKTFDPDLDRLGGYSDLAQYALPSPDQEDAGSCLYMAITGIAEWWLARLNPQMSRASDGPLDLSERFIMNFAGVEENETDLPNWRTDAIYLFNKNQNSSVLNSAYRYTKGWYLGEAYSDQLIPSEKGVAGAEYGTLFNWIDLRSKYPQIKESKVALPTFEREVLYADPHGNQWNVGEAPDNIVDRVKEALRVKKAPVMVVYNQNSYWHAVYLVGYNDEMDNGKCDYTERFRVRISARAEELAKAAAEATDPVVKSAYEIRAKRAREAKDKIEKAYATRGGCTSGKGVFYIRDSIYPDFNGPKYRYDLDNAASEAPYTKKVVFKEYDWLRYFSNHVMVVYPKGYSASE